MLSEGDRQARFFQGMPDRRSRAHQRVDDVAGSIVAHTEELAYDLVIMCSHGRGAALHLFLGSIAQSVIARGSHPVLITHPDPQGTPPSFSCRHLLVPMDNDPEHAQALARKYTAQIPDASVDGFLAHRKADSGE